MALGNVVSSARSYADALSRASAFSQHPLVTDASPADLKVPLCVDLDGTYLNTDLVWESLKDLSRRRPWIVALYWYWLLQGRPRLKHELAVRARLNLGALPFHTTFHGFLRAEKQRGRQLILATASDAIVAQQVVGHAGIFNGFVASDGRCNLRGAAKAALLTERYGRKGFDYAGNSRMDLPVWSAARQAIVVNASPKTLHQARQLATVAHVFPPEPGNPSRAPW